VGLAACSGARTLVTPLVNCLGVLDSSSTTSTLYSYMAYGLGALDIRLYRQKKKRIVYRVPRAPTAVPCTVQYMYSYGCRAVLGFAFM
jgi:hypothetical protein